MNLVKSKQIWIVITYYQTIWIHTEFSYVLNRSEKCNYNTNLVQFNKIEKGFHCVTNRDLKSYRKKSQPSLLVLANLTTHKGTIPPKSNTGNSRFIFAVPFSYFLFIFYLPQCTLPDFPSVLPWLPCHFYLVVFTTTSSHVLDAQTMQGKTSRAGASFCCGSGLHETVTKQISTQRIDPESG